jgi:hypothetical protein
LDLVSVDLTTNACVDSSDFSVAYWGWLVEGSFRWSPPPLIQDGRCGAILDLVSVDFLTNAWVDWSELLGLIGVTGGWFLSMTSTAAHPTWPLRQQSWSLFPLIIWRTPASTGPIFCGSLGVHVLIFTIFHFSLNLIFHMHIYPQTTSNSGHMPRLA